jgi:heat shock protein HslJ
MRVIVIILTLPLLFISSFAEAQKGKNKKIKPVQTGPRIMEVVGDSLRSDSVVYYETEIGYIMPDLSPKFRGRWTINVMRRQARAVPDSLLESFFEFKEDTLFTARVGCDSFSGKYIIKGPTIKFTILDSASSECHGEVEQWFIKLIQERVSYFGIDEKILYLKDGAFNIVFDCARKPEPAQ